MPRPRCVALVLVLTSLVALPGCGGSDDGALTPDEARYAKQYDAFCARFGRTLATAEAQFGTEGMNERQALITIQDATDRFLRTAIGEFNAFLDVPAPRSLGADFPRKLAADRRTANDAVRSLRRTMRAATTLREGAAALAGFQRLQAVFGSGEAVLPDAYDEAAPSCRRLEQVEGDTGRGPRS